jgi:hypothetical protein
MLGLQNDEGLLGHTALMQGFDIHMTTGASGGQSVHNKFHLRCIDINRQTILKSFFFFTYT